MVSYTIKEFAEKYGVTYFWVRQEWIKKGMLKADNFGNGETPRYLIKEEYVKEFFENNPILDKRYNK